MDILLSQEHIVETLNKIMNLSKYNIFFDYSTIKYNVIKVKVFKRLENFKYTRLGYFQITGKGLLKFNKYFSKQDFINLLKENNINLKELLPNN